ncbi:hypothetical protein [Paenibacillus thermotolerans]|uniref:hypothetical protein n=1 Tax=Paenibacillus thermotolerans TaxID=3027807 RepID=UPI00236774AB|nr:MULTISPECIES: hypothetical protein [unclassified Paenibacillus]
MKRRAAHFAAVIVAASLFFTGLRFAAAMPELSPKADAALKRLHQTSGGTLSVRWNEASGTPYRMRGRLSGPSRHTPPWIAYSFMNEVRALYGIANPDRDLEITEIRQTSTGSVLVEMQRYLFGIPVLGNALTIEIDGEGVVRNVEGTIHPGLEKKKFYKPIKPAIKEKDAVRIALSCLPAGKPIVGDPSVQLYYLPERNGTPLVYMVSATVETEEGPGILCRILVHSVMGHIIR